MTRLRLQYDENHDMALSSMILWANTERFLSDLTEGEEANIEISTRRLKNGIRLRTTEKVEDCPDSHIWATDDGVEVTLCDARMTELFPGAKTVWVRVAK